MLTARTCMPEVLTAKELLFGGKKHTSVSKYALIRVLFPSTNNQRRVGSVNKLYDPWKPDTNCYFRESRWSVEHEAKHVSRFTEMRLVASVSRASHMDVPASIKLGPSLHIILRYASGFHRVHPSYTCLPPECSVIFVYTAPTVLHISCTRKPPNPEMRSLAQASHIHESATLHSVFSADHQRHYLNKRQKKECDGESEGVGGGGCA